MAPGGAAKKPATRKKAAAAPPISGPPPTTPTGTVPASERFASVGPVTRCGARRPRARAIAAPPRRTVGNCAGRAVGDGGDSKTTVSPSRPTSPSIRASVDELPAVLVVPALLDGRRVKLLLLGAVPGHADQDLHVVVAVRAHRLRAPRRRPARSCPSRDGAPLNASRARGATWSIAISVRPKRASRFSSCAASWAEASGPGGSAQAVPAKSENERPSCSAWLHPTPRIGARAKFRALARRPGLALLEPAVLLDDRSMAADGGSRTARRRRSTSCRCLRSRGPWRIRRET